RIADEAKQRKRTRLPERFELYVDDTLVGEFDKARERTTITWSARLEGTHALRLVARGTELMNVPLPVLATDGDEYAFDYEFRSETLTLTLAERAGIMYIDGVLFERTGALARWASHFVGTLRARPLVYGLASLSAVVLLVSVIAPPQEQ